MEKNFTDKLETILKKRFAGFRRLISCDRLTAGANKETYRIVVETDAGERRLAMRRAPGGAFLPAREGGAGLYTEVNLLTSARRCGVPEPEIYFTLETEDGLGQAFLMEWLDGETLGARIVRSETLAAIRPRLAYECGQILARIHSIDLGETGLAKVLDTMSPERLVDQTWDFYKALKTPQPMIDYAARWLKEHLPHNARSALTHGDFRNGNIMVSPKGIVAVLDWELSHIGDPMRDLGWLCTNSWRFGKSDLPVGGFGHYEDLFHGYEEASGQKVDPEHVKFWEVFGSFWWAMGCLRMVDIYRSGGDKSLERLGIGRRSSECQVDCVNLLIPGPVELVA
ncbi:MAG: phosphotransferase family protein, partial [Betaproteobacteria bacterium HGW-Betaproteobacteria-18]